MAARPVAGILAGRGNFRTPKRGASGSRQPLVRHSRLFMWIGGGGVGGDGGGGWSRRRLCRHNIDSIGLGAAASLRVQFGWPLANGQHRRRRRDCPLCSTAVAVAATVAVVAAEAAATTTTLQQQQTR